MSTSTTPRRAVQASASGLLILLVVSIFLNYIDRGSLSIAAPLIEKELRLSPTDVGTLLSAFFWTYALLQLVGLAGWLADRFPVGWVLAIGFIVWSGATMVSGLVSGFAALFIARLLLGAGESVSYPCYSKILAESLPPEKRGFANSLIDAGSKLGPALGTFLGSLVLDQYGWRAFFILLGGGSLIWLVPWLIYMPRGANQTRIDPADLPATAEILSQRSAWGTFFGHFCGNYYWYFLLTWLPSYLVKARGFSIAEMGRLSSIVFFAIASATVVAGYTSDWLIARGHSMTKVRKSIVCGGLTGATVILPVAVIQDPTWAIVLLFLSSMSFGVYASNHWATMQTLSGPRAAGRWTSLMNGVGNLAGVAAAYLTGKVVDVTGSFFIAFLVAATIALAGAGFWGLVVGEVRPVQWKTRGAAR